MTTTRIALYPGETSQLRSVIAQFIGVLDCSTDDPALSRLSPDTYPDDPAASRELHALTRDDAHARRRTDARMVLDTLESAPPDHDRRGHAVSLDHAQAHAWMRTLSAIRLVMAVRLGIDRTEATATNREDHAGYDWLGYRLHSVVEAMDATPEHAPGGTPDTASE